MGRSAGQTERSLLRRSFFRRPPVFTLATSSQHTNILLTMAKAKKGSGSVGAGSGAAGVGGEKQVQKSPAEFFAENQAIAGFDNLGKSLYTSVRELVENALDACESIGELPDIRIDVTEYTQSEFNKLSGIGESPRKSQKDRELFAKKKGAGSRAKGKQKDNDGDSKKAAEEKEDGGGGGGGGDDGKKANSKRKGGRSSQKDAYFMLTVRDNGCGMSHNAIPDLLGRVLSGSKYGVRQTRGKFGLGAKMALIWSKKSSGQPIRIKTSHRPKSDSGVPTHVSECVLDIDIYKNTPKIIEHKKHVNTEGWIGTEVQVLIAGNWTTYKSRIVQYLQQLAIITPYAVLEMQYDSAADPDGKRAMNLRYDRRSEQMPPPSKQVKHHPSSVNNLVVQQLVQFTKTMTLAKFLSKELSCVSPSIASRLIAELGSGYDESMAPSDLTQKQITRLVQLLRQVQLFKAPDGSCLSPLGEYNLRLGIQKVLEPDLIATARDKPGAYEGHPFVVEAAVSLGGKDVKEGITVVRFANRIPLLFEGGADVSTRVAQTKIRWSNYKIDHKKDKVGVFVSIVSTKIPFKGTSKEYIGDDATEIQLSVKRALQSCCQQLRARLSKRNALKDAKERKSRLVKYVPDVGRSLFGILDAMRKRQADDAPSAAAAAAPSPTKRRRLNDSDAKAMIQLLDRGEVTEETIRSSLSEAIDDQLKKDDLVLDDKSSSKGRGSKHGAAGRGGENAVPVFLIPLYNLDDGTHDVRTSLFTFRPIVPLGTVAGVVSNGE